MSDDLAYTIFQAIWDMSQEDELWPICGDDMPAAQRIAAAVTPLVAQMLADERERIAREIEDDAARAWGGDASWFTTGSKVASLVAEWIRSDD